MIKQVLTPYKFNQDKLAQDILSRLNRDGQLAMCKVFIQLENAMTQDQKQRAHT